MAAPRIALVIVEYRDAETLARTLDRVPPAVLGRLEQILLVEDAGRGLLELPAGAGDAAGWRAKLRRCRSRSRLDYGGRQKLGYDVALRAGMDIVVLLHGSGHYAPEVMAELLAPVEAGAADAVLGSRLLARGPGRRLVPLGTRLVSALLSWIQERCVGLRVSAFYSGFRVYRSAALRDVPYHRLTNERYFDTELLMQLHAAEFRIGEQPIPPYEGSGLSVAGRLQYAAQVVRSAIAYRLHRSGLRSAERFEVGPPRYPAKTGRWSSHRQLPEMIPAGHRVLDLGCGEGLLSERLSRRGCRVIGVDQHVGARAKASCIKTYALDLDGGLGMLDEAPFDTILLADVLSHLTEPDAVLAQCHQRLRSGGQLIISVGNVAHLSVRLSLLLGRFEYTPRGILERKHAVLYTLKSLKRLLASQQFRVAGVRVTPVPFESVWPRAAGHWWVQGLSAVSYALARAWQTLFAYQFLVVATPVARPGAFTIIEETAGRAAQSAPEACGTGAQASDG